MELSYYEKTVLKFIAIAMVVFSLGYVLVKTIEEQTEDAAAIPKLEYKYLDEVVIQRGFYSGYGCLILKQSQSFVTCRVIYGPTEDSRIMYNLPDDAKITVDLLKTDLVK